MKAEFWAILALAITLMLAWHDIDLSKRLDIVELQQITMDGELKTLLNKGYQETN